MNNKEEILYNLRQIERMIVKTLFLLEDERKLEESDYNLRRIKKQLIDVMFDIDETK